MSEHNGNNTDDIIRQANEALSEARSDIKTVTDLADEIGMICKTVGVEFMLGLSAILYADNTGQDKYLHFSTNGNDVFKLECIKTALNQIKNKGILEQLLPIIMEKLEGIDNAPEQDNEP